MKPCRTTAPRIGSFLPRTHLFEGKQFFTTAVIVIFALTACEQSQAPTAEVVEEINGHATIIDGDSLQVGSTEIRLWGIDAVEFHQQCDLNGQSWPCGRKAKDALDQKTRDVSIRCQAKDTDRYNRIVAECFKAGESLNAWMVCQGWALAYRRFTEKFLPDEQSARDSKRGIWQGAFEKPWDWRRNR